MKCPHCGYESNVNFINCPACGSAASHPYAAAYQQPNPYMYAQPRKKSGAEIASMVIAIIVAALSPIMAYIIFLSAVLMKTPSEYIYGMPDSDYTYSSDFDGYSFNKYDYSNPAPKNTPVEFEEKLFSFSHGYIKTKYEVTMEETYRGEAADKLLSGAKIPELNSMQEIFLVKFNVNIIEQDSPAYVTLTSFSAAALNDNAYPYQSLNLIDYKDNTQLLMEGESGTRWMAFIVDKDAENPFVAWNDDTKCKYFLNTEQSISDPSLVIEGEAVETNTSNDDTSSIE